MIYRSELERICEVLTHRKQALAEELTTLPEGEFYTYMSRGIRNYCERFPATGNRKKERRKGVKRNPDRLNKLVRKVYVTQAIEKLDGDIEALEKLISQYEPFDENSVMEDFVKEYPELTDGIYKVQSGSADSKATRRKASDKELFYESGLKSTASDGTGRRSLGELVIGSRLDFYKIPYKYEEPLSHPDLRGRFSPDFTIVRPRDGKTIYWEHLGRVNDEEYMSYNKYKLDTYERYGIVPWSNLIISYSQPDFGVNEKLVDGLIQGWLL